MIGLLRRLWTWASIWWHPPPPSYTLRYLDELPEVPLPGVLYVAGEPPHLWAATLLCPCTCGETLHLSLLEDTSPSWLLLDHGNGSCTLSPSVWKVDGCRSHFFLRRGCIYWVSARHDGDDAGSL